MAKRKPKQVEEASDGSGAWLNTYADMVTLLFAFFVLLFAISQVDVQKFNLLAAALSNRGASPDLIMEIAEQSTVKNVDEVDVEDPFAPVEEGEDTEPTLADIYEMIQSQIERAGLNDTIFAYLGDDYIFIRFIDDMLFGPNSARIRQQDYEILRFIGRSLRVVQGSVGMIRIDGHTASVPNSAVSDRDLSSERANAVLKYFEDVVGIDGEKLTALAFGRFRPIAENETEEGRRQNRRIEIVVTESNEVIAQLDNIYEKIVG
ncbi:MAG: OmpA family protein [Oscillospiraceae bacterium]|nr:OmpA family protein [Oscillospiraceae bacterium]